MDKSFLIFSCEKEMYYVITVRETDIGTNDVSINQYVEEI